jgi:hypothetical protein
MVLAITEKEAGNETDKDIIHSMGMRGSTDVGVLCTEGTCRNL